MTSSTPLAYDVFVADPIAQNVTDLVPNGDRRMFSPLSITLVHGERDAVLVDPPLTSEQAEAVGDWVESTGKNLTHIFATHGHGDHWFTAGILAERFGAEVVASEGTIKEMHRNVSIRPQFWDRLFPGQIPDAPVTAVTVPDNRFSLEGHELVIVEVGHSDTDETSVLHVPDLTSSWRATSSTTACTSTWPSPRTAAVTPGARPSTRSKGSGRAGSSPVTRTRPSTTTPPAPSPRPASTSTPSTNSSSATTTP